MYPIKTCYWGTGSCHVQTLINSRCQEVGHGQRKKDILTHHYYQLSISPSLVHLVPTILRRSPNLESLALDSDDYYCLSNTTITTSTGAETKNIDHGNILQIVYEACPNLQWMSLVPCASARTTFYEDTLDNEDYSDYGLYGLSLCGKYLQLSNPKDIYPLLKKNHSTLRSLHLVYDGSPLFWYTLYYLGQLGVPKLRELSLNTLDGAGFHTSRCSTTLALSPEEADKNGGNRTLSFEQVFLQLIKRAPPLQSMHFDADGGNIPPELRVTEAMFAGLAKRQSQSRLLRLTAMHCCQPGSLTQFSRTPSTRIEQLTCDCNAFKNSDDLRQLLKKAQKLWAFQTLHVSSDQLYDPLFDPARMTIRLRSFFDGSDRNDDCDCVRQKIFTPQERSIVKQILNLRDPNYASL
ncbi:hypothetical protein BDA99DRAFT_63433 [Phascolomyces articulosus]|uniref:Uncharacterized protein n=1 Tax=Phascolomyces articulosus TaxID=60185 RepID=A0AAD5PFN7_9FUNG|nr:hypothetical protein BDA99DRAFT_63433 [Phascolomyces articulosus]